MFFGNNNYPLFLAKKAKKKKRDLVNALFRLSLILM